MYNNYPTIYETTIDQNIIYLIIFGVFLLILLIVSLVSLAKIFKKANRSGISAFIPIYNIIMLLEITNTSKWYLLLMLIPGINIVFYLLVMFSLAKFFRKSKAFALGLTFLPFIFYPILAFGNNEYIGINLVAMEGKSVVVEIPKVMDQEESNPVIHEEQDTSLKNINISIGGGVYQKDYTNTLLQVDQNQAITNKNSDLVNNNTSPNQTLNSLDPSKNLFFKPAQEEVKMPVTESPKNLSIEFPNLINLDSKNKGGIFKQEVTPNNNLVSLENLTPQNNNTQVNNNVLVNNVTPITQQQQVPTNNLISQPMNTNQLNQFSPSNQSVQSNQILNQPGFKTCPKCGAQVKSDSRACFLCGQTLE